MSKKATSENIREEFDDLGFTLDDPQIVDQLVALCDIYNLPEDKVSCEYLAYLNQKKYVINQSPTIEILEGFENDALKPLSLKSKEKSSGPKIYNSTTLHQHPSFKESNYEDEEDEDGDLSNYYGTSTTPARPKPKKREFSPEALEDTNKKRLTANNLSYSPTTTKTYGDSDILNTPTQSQGQKYSSRTNAGKVLIRFGNGGNALPATTWKSQLNEFFADVKVHSPCISRKEYRYMFERLREKAGYLDEIICQIGEILVDANQISEPQTIQQVSPEPFNVVGRICCDSEGKLNSKSIVIQGSQDVCLGRSIPLDASKVPEYPLFPGQIVVAEVTNPAGKKLIANTIHSDASSTKSTSRVKLLEGDELQVVVACGPYTTAENLSYAPLDDLLKYIDNHKPHVVILCGPFVDSKHSDIDGCKVEEPFEQFFGRIMSKIADLLERLPQTQVLVVPSGSRDVHHTFIYPTPPFEEAQKCKRIRMMTDPCIVNVEGISFGITSTDILFHLGKDEMSIPRAGDKLKRLATHLIQQRSFYPLYPPSEEVNIDYEQLERVARIDIRPDILILPSDFQHFFKEINGCLAMNPSRMARGESGGVFARLVIRGSSTENFKFINQVSAEIVRI